MIETAAANRIFSGILERYDRMKALAATVEHRPEVIVNTRSGNRWMVYGNQSVAAQISRDAGGEYVWRSVNNGLSQTPVALELALERGFTVPHLAHRL